MANLKELCIDNFCTQVDLSDYLKIEDLVDSVYPVGSVVVMPTNTNPSTIYTGTEWQLYDKAFKSAYYNDIATWNTTNVTAMNADIRLADHSAVIRVQFRNKIAISDATMNVCSLDMTRFINLAGWNNVSTSIFSDTLNAIGAARIYITGDTIKVDAEDWVTRATSYPTTTDASCSLNVATAYSYEEMLDSACDKFYFRRTA